MIEDPQHLTILEATAIAEGIEAFFLMTSDPSLSREEALQKAKRSTATRLKRLQHERPTEGTG